MALGPAVDALIEEIHYALSFFWTAATDERIDMLLPERRRRADARAGDRGSAERIEAPVEVTDPFSRIAIDARRSTAPRCSAAPRSSPWRSACRVRRPGDK